MALLIALQPLAQGLLPGLESKPLIEKGPAVILSTEHGTSWTTINSSLTETYVNALDRNITKPKAFIQNGAIAPL
jgi:hypothetical protein